MKAFYRTASWVLASLIVMFALPALAGNSSYFQYMIEIIAIYVIASAGLNIAIGFAGQYQMAQAAVMAVAAYALAVLHLDQQWALGSAAVASIFLALLLGAIVALLSARLKSHYLLLATFGLQIIAIGIIRELVDYTGGVNGRPAVVVFNLFGFSFVGATYAYSALMIGVAAIGLFVCGWFKHNYVGLGTAAIRQSERIAEASGLHSNLFKFLAVLLSTLFAAVAGILIGPIHTYLDSGSFGVEITLLLLIIVVVGGAGSVAGVAIAAVILAVASQIAQSATTAWPLIYGLFVMTVLTITSKGLAGVWKSMTSRAPAIPPSAALNDVKPSPAVQKPIAVKNDEKNLILSIRGLRKAFGGVVAVDNVSFDVVRGSVHGLVGPNGSGKTTLFEMLSGFVKPNAGTIMFDGKDISTRPPAERARLGLGRSFQLASILPDCTVLENALLGDLAAIPTLARLRRVQGTDSDAVRRARGALAIVGLRDLEDKLASTLAYGQRKLLDIARAIVAKPLLILLDEPLAGVDAVSANYARNAIVHLKESGSTVVVVEHNMRFIMGICDRVTALDVGRILITGTPAEVSTNPEVIRSYLGEKRSGPKGGTQDADSQNNAVSNARSVAG